MQIYAGTEQFGQGQPTTIEAPAVDCPQCGEIVFTEKIGEVSCDECGRDFYAHNHRGESCTAVECDDCSEAISFIKEHRVHFGDWEGYFCHHCSKTIAIETANGPQPLELVLSTDWVLNEREIDEIGTLFGESTWAKRTQTGREELATSLLNSEARVNDSSFHAYVAGSTNAHLCFSDEYCVGYITWNADNENPELGQLYLLPAFRQQGIGSEFVEVWREDVAGPDGRFSVNNPNANMYRLLRSIGAIEVTEEGLEFPECDITGHSVDLPSEWGPDPPS